MSNATAASGLAPRQAALNLLDQILEQRKLLPEAIAAGTLASLEPADRARAQRLALETLRGMERADRVLQKHLRKPPPAYVQNALRLGAVELCNGGAAHGVVNAYVELVNRQSRHRALKGLVNAVLRKVAATGQEHWNNLRVPRLPKWVRSPLVQAWGSESVTAMEAAHFRGAALDLTAKADPEAVARSVSGEVLPNGSVRLHDAGQVSGLPGFATGEWWVQDAAAALPARILAPAPDMVVLDMCAAPGGKTMQLAATGANVTAVDDSQTRLERLNTNLSRTGLKAEVIVGDVFAHQCAPGHYDAILLDAPCSATGTLRRHPDLPFAKDGSEFAALISAQAVMIDHLWPMLKPGGRMVYCTCSLLPDEGEVQIEAALTRHQDMVADTDALCVAGVDPGWLTAEGGLRLRPDYWAEAGGMDGFYIAALRKSG